MKPIISIIIPVYNVEKYIHRCIESILSQTFTNFELLLINDGSSDKSGDICDDFALEDSRIRVIHQKNGGVSRARNKGIKLAQGDFLMFCDSDDYVEKNWCSQLIEAVKKDNRVLPVSGIKLIYNLKEKREVIKTFSQNVKIGKDEYFEIYKKELSGGLWCKIYDRHIIEENSLDFDVNVSRAEDLLFNLKYITYMDSIVTVPAVTYNYVHSNENSLINRYRIDLSDINILVYSAWKEYLNQINADREKFGELATYFYFHFLGVLKNTFDERNKDNLLKKLKQNHNILNSKEFSECLELADTSKENAKYINLLKRKNYYIVWFVEQAIRVKKKLTNKKYKDIST